MPSRFPPRCPPSPRWAGSAAPRPSPGRAAPSPQDSLLHHPPTLLHPFVFFHFFFFLFPLPLFLLSVRLSARGTASNAGSLPYGAPPGLEGPPAPAPQPPSTQPRRRCAGADPALFPAASPHHRTLSFSLSLSLLPPTHTAGERDRPGTTPMNNPHRLARRGRSGAGGAGIAVPFPLPRRDHTPLTRGEVRPPSRFWAEGARRADSPGGRAEAAQTGAHPTPVSISPALRPSLNLSCPVQPTPTPLPVLHPSHPPPP